MPTARAAAFTAQSGDQGALFRVLCMIWLCDQHCMAHLPALEYTSRLSTGYLADAFKAMGRVRSAYYVCSTTIDI
jgi:hypothetical protein